jgi:hypothetical protein
VFVSEGSHHVKLELKKFVMLLSCESVFCYCFRGLRDKADSGVGKYSFYSTLNKIDSMLLSKKREGKRVVKKVCFSFGEK